MKETTNVSIAGIAFRLDNEGYLQLKNYLTRIELGYKNNPDGAEILADIEARVCELILNQQSADQLVPADRIRDIIEQLGMPDDFPATDNTETDGTGTSIDRNAVLPNEENGSGHSPLPRRLYRNPEGAKLGGVCSGLGTYFNVEPVFIRLAFLAPIPLIPLSAIITHDGAPSAFFAILFSAFSCSISCCGSPSRWHEPRAKSSKCEVNGSPHLRSRKACKTIFARSSLHAKANEAPRSGQTWFIFWDGSCFSSSSSSQ